MFSGSMNAKLRLSAMPIPAMSGINMSPVPTRPIPVTASAQDSAWSDVSMDEVHHPAKAAPVPASVVADASNLGISRQSEPHQSMAMSLPDMPPLDLSTSSGFNLNEPVAISKGNANAPFTISCESQRELISSLAWKSAACIWGGPALTVACIYVLLLTLGWL